MPQRTTREIGRDKTRPFFALWLSKEDARWGSRRLYEGDKKPAVYKACILGKMTAIFAMHTMAAHVFLHKGRGES